MKTVSLVSFILVIVGGLNWLLVGLFNWNLVDAIFGFGTVGSKIIYILVGIATVIYLFTYKKFCCGGSDSTPATV